MSKKKQLQNSAGKYLEELAYLGEGNKTGITSSALLKHMNKKYKMNTFGQKINHPDWNNVLYTENKDALVQHVKGTPFSDAVKKIDGRKISRGMILTHKDVFKKAPELIGHELGHAADFKTKIGRATIGLGYGAIAKGLRLGGLGLAIAGVVKKNPKMVLGGGAAAFLPDAATLVNEYRASSLANKNIKELGGTSNKKRYASGYSTYLLHSAIVPALTALGASIANR